MKIRRRRTVPRTSFSLAIVAAVVTAVIVSLGIPAIAYAAPTAVLDIVKTVDKPNDVPGDSFVYKIEPSCSTDNCVDAQLVDVLPTQFDALTLNTTVVITGGPSNYSWGGPNGRTLTVNFLRPFTGGVGIPAGAGYTIQVGMTVPAGLPPDWPSNGVAVPNTATVSASTATTKQSSANVTVTIPYVIDTTVAKTWTPSSTQFRVGELSTITLTSQNSSNARASALTLTEPADPAAANNPFDKVTFSGFGAFAASDFPAGADRITVDAYVAGSWVPGTPASAPALPLGVDPTTVVGVRATFSSSTGATLTGGGAAGILKLQVTQRAATRSTSASLVTGTSVPNTATGTVTVPGQPPVSKSASATYTVVGLNSQVGATKSFTPSRIPAGTSSTALVTARNASNGPLASLSVTEPGSGTFFGGYLRFGGFSTSGSSWPAGATSATVDWQVDTGAPPPSSSFTSAGPLPATPALSGQIITGFVVTYTGAIAAGSTAGVAFLVDVAGNAVPTTPGSVTFTNVARVDGSNDAGPAAPATASAVLTVLAPEISVSLSKTITPSAAVPAGARSVAQLRAQTSSDSGYVVPNTITIIDQRGAAALDYWNAFDAIAINPTQVSLGSTLAISYTTDGTTWIPFATVDATSAAQLYSAPLPAPTANIVGVKFVFSNTAGYAQGTVVRPAISFQAQATLRDNSGPTATGADVTYTNTISTVAVGSVQLSGSPVTVTATATATATAIVKASPAGPGGLKLAKAWQPVSGSSDVFSQSGQQRTARINWATELTGYLSAVVSDPANETLPVAQTVFQAFDLARIQPITTSTDPLVAFDKITAIELFDGTSWTGVTSCTVVTPCLGGFAAGYTLTTAQMASTVAVRVSFAEWAGGRSTDPLSPPVGSGVASGPGDRRIDLLFQLRNKLRDASATPSNPWVTAARVYNSAPDAGLVVNTALLTLTPGTGSPVTGTASDIIRIVDGLPQLSTTKSSSKTTIAIPNPGDVLPGNYPITTFTMTATNTSYARAWYLRVTDPMPCAVTAVTDCVHNSVGPTRGYTINPYTGATYDPGTNPFERFTMTRVAPALSSNSGISLANSTVTLWKFDGTTQNVTADAAGLSYLASAANLVDVVGVSVLFASTSTAGGGTIASGAVATLNLDAQLRQNLRSSPSTLVAPTTVTNSSFSQIYDDVLDDTNRYQSRSATVALVTGTIAVTAAKSFAPSTTLLEANRATDVTVNLGATQGSSTASTREVVVEDSSAAFWNAFALRSLGTVTFPAGADRVRVDVRLDGSAAWTLGTASSTATLAAIPSGRTVANVTGIRFVFTRVTNGPLFSTTAPGAPWSTSEAFTVRVRDNYLDSGLSVLFPSTVDNTVLTSSTHDVFGTATGSATASMNLVTGTFTVDVEKRPSTSLSPAGEVVDFSLIFTNTGTGYLVNPVIVDSLPVDAGLSAGGPLIYDPTSVATHTTSSGGILPVTGVTAAYDSTSRKVTYSWPAGSRLAPGEKYTIVLGLQIAPGLLAAYGPATNSFSVSSDRVLSACTNVSGNAQGVSWSVDRKSCSTSNKVSTYAASAISSFKGVKGNIDGSGVSTSGAMNVIDPATSCVADFQGFYRTPCAANTVIGGTDLWKIQFTNGGNVVATSATLVDVLPRAGDTFLRTGTSRGSVFAPAFAGSLVLPASAPAGTVMTWQLTTSANPCSGTTFETNSTCSGSTWVDGPSFNPANYPLVTAVRAIFDFSAVSGGGLAPAATLPVTYKTVNLPTLSIGDGRAPLTAPVTSARAWSTFGIFATFGSGYSDRRVEPVKAGVQIATGPIQVTKVITGPSAALAPLSFTVTASCAIAGATMVLPSGGMLTLASTSATPYTGRIDGIPLGAQCRIVENPGSSATAVSYAPTSRSGAPAAVLDVTIAAGPADAVPVSQRATVTNSYGVTIILAFTGSMLAPFIVGGLVGALIGLLLVLATAILRRRRERFVGA